MIAAARAADRLEQVVKGYQIDAVAFLEIGLGFARDVRGEMEDHVGATGHQPAARILVRNIERVRVDLAGKCRGMIWRDDIDQRELVYRLAVEPSVADEPCRQLAPDHAGRAGDENVHEKSLLLRLARLRGE